MHCLLRLPLGIIISYSILYKVFFNVKVYNLLGENVDSYSKIKLKQGVNQFNWKPNQQVSGIYFYQIELNNAIYKQKVLFIK